MGFMNGLAGIGTWAFGNDGIGGKSGAIGKIGDFLVGTNDTRKFDQMGNIINGNKGTGGLFGNIGNYIENNPTTTKAIIGGLGGLAQYSLGKEQNKINQDRYNHEAAIQNQQLALQRSEINRAHTNEDKAKKDFQAGLAGYLYGQSDPYAHYNA